MIFYHPKWNFVSVKMTDMKSIPALSFKRTCALNATSNESALVHFISSKLCSQENLMPLWNFISIKMTDMKSIPFWVSFCVNSCEHRSEISTEMKSHTGLSSFRLSWEYIHFSKLFGFICCNVYNLTARTHFKTCRRKTSEWRTFKISIGTLYLKNVNVD